jgi:hypothetical protein
VPLSLALPVGVCRGEGLGEGVLEKGNGDAEAVASGRDWPGSLLPRHPRRSAFPVLAGEGIHALGASVSATAGKDP